jgi:ParB-like chromosome segregation protein Spo0J
VTKRRSPRAVVAAFERAIARLAVVDISPLREVRPKSKMSAKYAQIAASVREVGIVEPLVVARDQSGTGGYHLLDGHLRLEILRDMGETEVVCLVATEDEAFTYNRRVNRITVIQEHKMILKALGKGVPEARLARALNVDIANIRSKRRLLAGIAPEVAELLRDRQVPVNSFRELRRMKPLRQIEAAELMIAMNLYSTPYARSLVAATPAKNLVQARKPRRGLSHGQLALMERESANLDREFKLIEHSYGSDHLDLVLAAGYIGRLLQNLGIVRYLAQHYSDLLAELQKIAQPEAETK